MEVNRIGVDIDTHCGYSLLSCWIRGSLYGKAVCYYTKHGFHVDVKLDKGVTHIDALHIRRMLGDDADRLRIDEARVNDGADINRFDTLFEVRLKDGETYSRREINPLACSPFPYTGTPDQEEIQVKDVLDAQVYVSKARGRKRRRRGS